MIKSIEEKVMSLVKRFYKLQERDNVACCKTEKKILKKKQKAVEMTEKKAKIQIILATEKPVSLLALPENKMPLLKKPSKVKGKQI